MPTRRAIVIYNPRSGAHRRRDRAAEIGAFVAALQSHGLRVESRATTGPGAAAAMARQAAAACDIVVASGGDGTLNEVLQGMIGSDTPLGIWPGGTANVLARDLGLPSDARQAAFVIATGRERRITVGLASNEGQRRYFFLMAGIGLDASVIRGVPPRLKARYGEAAFWLSGLRHLVAWRPQPFTLEINGHCHKTAFAVIGNSPRYGGGLRLTPRASLDEPLLDVCLFPVRRFACQYAPDLLAALWGDPAQGNDVVYLKTRALAAYRATSDGRTPPWVQIDGELLGQLPMRFEAVPEALAVIVPAQTVTKDTI